MITNSYRKNSLLPALHPLLTRLDQMTPINKYDYSYFWWSNPVSQQDKKTTIFLARGAGGQNLIVNREKNLVVVITAWNMQQPNKPQLIYDRYLVE